MKTHILFSAIILITLGGTFSNAQQANFEWGVSMGGTSWDIGGAVASDNLNNVITVGSYYGTVDFNPDTSVTTTLSGSGGFIQKKDSNGNLLWIKGINGSIDFWSMAIDSIGDIYLTGTFSNTVDFNPGVFTYNLSSNGDYDIFALKIDSNGDMLWAKSLGGTGTDYGQEISIDSLMNVYITGFFENTVDFDPGNGALTLNSNGGKDIFVLKLDNVGNLSWAKSLGGLTQDKGFSICLDYSGNIYTTGSFEGTVDFDPGNGIYNLTAIGSSSNIFIQKLDNTGGFIWAKSMGSSSTNSGHCINADMLGNIFVTGHFEGTVDFDPGNSVSNQTAVNGNNIFLLKLNGNGNFVWIKTIAAGGFNGVSLTLDDSANVYLTSHYWASADFDPGIGVVNLTPTGNADIFIQKLDMNGDFIWAVSIGGSQLENSIGISSDGLNNIYLTGSFAGTADLNPGAGINNYVSNGSDDVFTLKFNQSFPTHLKGINNEYSHSIYPNPTDNLLFIERNPQEEEIYIYLFDSFGKLLLSENTKSSISKLSLINLPSGFYYVSLKNERYTATYKIIKQ